MIRICEQLGESDSLLLLPACSVKPAPSVWRRGTLKEAARLLKPDGFSIFQEPIRDSRLAKLARRMFPPTAPDISPFKRPFETRELFGAPVKMMMSDVRKFRLPHIPILGEHKWAVRMHRWLLAHLPVAHWASVMV